jgi:hypothetical protein
VIELPGVNPTSPVINVGPVFVIVAAANTAKVEAAPNVEQKTGVGVGVGVGIGVGVVVGIGVGIGVVGVGVGVLLGGGKKIGA